MRDRGPTDKALQAELKGIYEEIMWLARRSNVTASCARAWYTHVMSERVKRRIRWFSGKVSVAAGRSGSGPLRLEHYRRMQTTLTDLVERHAKHKRPRFTEFMRVVLECERVHIVTFDENYSAHRALGRYKAAGIALVPWKILPVKRRRELWHTMLRGRVANAKDYKPILE